MPSWISARNGLIVAAITIIVAGCGGGWWFLGSDDPETTTKPQIVTGPAAAASAPATKPAPTPPPQPTPPGAPKAKDEPDLATSPVEEPAATTNPLRCSNESWSSPGPLGGDELAVTIVGLKEVRAGTAILFIGGKVVCNKDGTVELEGKPLSVDELVSAKGFREALVNSRSTTLEVNGGRKVDVGNMTATHRTDTRPHYPEAATK